MRCCGHVRTSTPPCDSGRSPPWVIGRPETAQRFRSCSKILPFRSARPPRTRAVAWKSNRKRSNYCKPACNTPVEASRFLPPIGWQDRLTFGHSSLIKRSETQGLSHSQRLPGSVTDDRARQTDALIQDWPSCCTCRTAVPFTRAVVLDRAGAEQKNRVAGACHKVFQPHHVRHRESPASQNPCPP